MHKASLGSWGLALVTVFSSFQQVSALDAGSLVLEDLKVSGYVDGGRFQLADTNVNGEIVNRMGARWRLDKEISENWSALVDLHWFFFRNQATDIGLFHIAGLKFSSDLQGVLSYRSGSHRARMGIYEFKYNPDAKNLGEYLLRSEAYPTIIESYQGKDLFDPAFSRVGGIEYGLEHDLFRPKAVLYAEQYNVPVNDLNFVVLAEAGPKAAEIGAGVSFHRLFKFGKTTNTGELSPDLRAYVDSQGLTTDAVKLIARGRLDFGQLAGMDGFTLYAEAALLGLKKDTLYYKDMMQRMPMMAGIDIPTFGLLDNLSMEVEYFKNPYLQRKYSLKDLSGSNYSPLPFLDTYGPEGLPRQTDDDWRWSVHVHKALSRWLDLKVRLSSDHMRLKGYDGDFVGGEPMTKSSKDWYFLTRIEFHN